MNDEANGSKNMDFRFAALLQLEEWIGTGQDWTRTARVQ